MRGDAAMIPPAMMFTITKRSTATPGKKAVTAVVVPRTVPITEMTVVMFVAQLSLSVQAPEARMGRAQKSRWRKLRRRPSDE